MFEKDEVIGFGPDAGQLHYSAHSYHAVSFLSCSHKGVPVSKLLYLKTFNSVLIYRHCPMLYV